MSEQPKFVNHPAPNVTLRGGPLDGARIRVEHLAPYVDQVEAQRVIYRPTGETDMEFPTLTVFVFDRAVTIS